MLGKTLIECRVKTVLRPCRRSKDDHSVRVKQQTCVLPVKQLKRPTKHMDDFKIWCRIFFLLAGLAVFRYLEKGWFEPNYSPDLRFFIFCIPAESSYAAACLNKVNKVDDQSHMYTLHHKFSHESMSPSISSFARNFISSFCCSVRFLVEDASCFMTSRLLFHFPRSFVTSYLMISLFSTTRTLAWYPRYCKTKWRQGQAASEAVDQR